MIPNRQSFPAKNTTPTATAKPCLKPCGVCKIERLRQLSVYEVATSPSYFPKVHEMDADQLFAVSAIKPAFSING
jgi:hypothetical protein